MLEITPSNYTKLTKIGTSNCIMMKHVINFVVIFRYKILTKMNLRLVVLSVQQLKLQIC
jgi:hypothetical protein